MDLLINKLAKDQVLSSYNFARKADIVFAESLTRQQYEKLDLPKHRIVYEDDFYITYKLSEFKLNQNDVIYCNNYFFYDLFELLKDVNISYNLKLITGQTDKKINQDDFKLKPRCISKWYAPNINYSDDSLKPLPIGLANSHPKNLNNEHFKNLKINNFKIGKAYLNFEINTNYYKRKKIFKNLSQMEWVQSETGKLDLSEYAKKLNSYEFIICPPGNGLDTHRVWESIYSGSTPVVEKNLFYEKLEELPIVTVKKLQNINFLEIQNKAKKINKNNYNFLRIDWWMSNIKNPNSKISNSEILITEQQSEYDLNHLRFKKIIEKERRIKKYKTFNRKVLSKLI